MTKTKFGESEFLVFPHCALYFAFVLIEFNFFFQTINKHKGVTITSRKNRFETRDQQLKQDLRTALKSSIYRIFNASKKSAQKPTLISPKSQIIICSGIIFVQVIVNVIWMLILPPEAVHHHPTREDNLLVCKVQCSKLVMDHDQNLRESSVIVISRITICVKLKLCE